MARLTDSDKESLLADYHTNKYSQRELAKRHGVSLGTVSKLTKEVTPQNEHLVNAQTAVTEAKSELPNEQMNAIMNASSDEVRRRGLIFGNAEKLAGKIDTMSDQVDEPQDIKTLVDANHRVGQTLGVVDQFAPKIDINNTAAVQAVTEIKISDA